MTPIKTARRLRGLSQIALAEKLGVSPQALNQYECGARTPGPKLLPIAAEALDVSAAYLRGDAQRLSVRDHVTGEMIACPIVSETVVGSYGIFYLVEVEESGDVIAVILSGGTQLTLADWQGEQPMHIDEAEDYRWVDARGRDAAMLAGLPFAIVG